MDANVTTTPVSSQARRQAFFLLRWLLGILLTMAGYWKVFVLGAGQHAERFFVQGFQDYWIPEFLLRGLGLVIPFWELAAGLLLLIGFRLQWVLVSLGVLHLITTYGHALKEPLFDIDGHTFTRMALIIFLLVFLHWRDGLTLDARLKKNA